MVVEPFQCYQQLSEQHINLSLYEQDVDADALELMTNCSDDNVGTDL